MLCGKSGKTADVIKPLLLLWLPTRNCMKYCHLQDETKFGSVDVMCPHRSKVQGKVFILWYTTGYRRSGAQGKVQGYKGKCVPRVEGIQGTQGKWGRCEKIPPTVGRRWTLGLRFWVLIHLFGVDLYSLCFIFWWNAKGVHFWSVNRMLLGMYNIWIE